MKLTFLGTGAGEGYPGLWCRCPHCTYARRHGGKNLRANSCAVVDERLLLDIGPACFDNAARYGVDLTGITSLLITHPHEDHFYPQHLRWRQGGEGAMDLPYRDKLSHGGPRFTELPTLTLYGNAFVMKALDAWGEDLADLQICRREIREGEAIEADGGYRVTPVRGNHGGQRGFAHGYIIEKDGRTLLYALDTGLYDDDMLELLRSFRYNLIGMEGTTGLNEQYGGHMCLESNKKMLAFFRENGCLAEGAGMYLTHMSPHWCPPHDWYEAIAQAEGVNLAYDGLTVEI